ncbi:hypothetical protein NPIL_311841 [Nephila pilipes]|uniref:Uncharacterized protein n=1 Tax=Nephila pilipes TaxID=299642 RepID=A0A8X6NRQ1_NEPPI|nr:hypothetical protein NPIL_311841 [Nephila pilipes]
MTHCPSIPRRFSAPNSTTSPHGTVKAQSHTHSRSKKKNQTEGEERQKIEKKYPHSSYGIYFWIGKTCASGGVSFIPISGTPPDKMWIKDRSSLRNGPSSLAKKEMVILVTT